MTDTVIPDPDLSGLCANLIKNSRLDILTLIFNELKQSGKEIRAGILFNLVESKVNLVSPQFYRSLNLLVKYNLVMRRRDGYRVYYNANPKSLNIESDCFKPIPKKRERLTLNIDKELISLLFKKHPEYYRVKHIVEDAIRRDLGIYQPSNPGGVKK